MEVVLPYLIDGHNLIAALPNLALQDPDDERELIENMEAFCRLNRQRAILFFDRGHVASRPFRHGAWLQIRFVRSPKTADDAIRVELEHIGREAPNWTVVSSDREVQAAARQAGAKILSSPNFIRQLEGEGNSSEAAKPNRSLSPDEVEAWIDIFQRKKNSEDPSN